MNKENLGRLKKYLFLISMFFVIILWWHILYVYLYNDALENPIEWWSISEWIIWDFPNLNPLFSSNDYNKNIINMLYRSLMKYDFKEKKFVSDLADCDIKNIWYVECYLKDNIKWSNWTDITTKDIISTFNIIKNSDVNPQISSLLKETTIEEKDWAITFSNKIKDIVFLNVLLQPIVSKETLDSISSMELNWKFNPLNWIYSWKYMVDNVWVDESLWIQKLILVKNENYDNNDVLINRYVYRFFKDSSHFLKHKDTVNIFYDKEKIIWDTLIRLDKKTFHLNQYVSLFLNQDRITNQDLRTFILWKIDTEKVLKKLWNWYTEVKNPYMLDNVSINNEIKNSNIESIIKTLWYYKKDELNTSLKEDNQPKKEEVNNVEKKQENLKIIVSPITEKYNFLWKDDILVKWVVNENNVSEIYINNYKLSWYKKWNKDFYYRLKESFSNIKPWENKYVVEFNIWWERKKVEEFYIIYSKDEQKLKTLKDNFFAENNRVEEVQKTQIEIDKNISQQIKSLETNYYYNKNLEKFTFRLYYLDNQKEMLDIADYIKSTLNTYWIFVEMIPVSASEIWAKIISWQRDYDMILMWIDLWYFKSNIFPYFHSSQAKWWYNLSWKKDLNLDVILEELRSWIFTPERTLELQNKVLAILKDKSILKTLYTKENIVLVDRNIKNFNLEENLESTLWINQAVEKSYVNWDRQIIFETKWIFDFFRFIKNIFQNEWS